MNRRQEIDEMKSIRRKRKHMTQGNKRKDKWEVENIAGSPIAGTTLTWPPTVMSLRESSKEYEFLLRRGEGKQS